jgi:hypothetical protein
VPLGSTPKPGRHWPGFFVAFAALACTAAGAVGPGPGDYLARMDGDHDGRVSLVEYQDWLCYGFDAMDRNHDGMLSRDELPGGRGQAISRDAHRARLALAFARQDRDGDGYLDPRELASPPR